MARAFELSLGRGEHEGRLRRSVMREYAYAHALPLVMGADPALPRWLHI